MAEIIPFDASKSISFTPKEIDWSKRCSHEKILVDNNLGYIECQQCHEHLDPIQYLYQIAIAEKAMDWRVDTMREFEKKILGKNICKCEKCGQMTKIVR